MEAAIAFVTCLGCILVLIPVHETGHYLAGWAAGLPRRDMRIRLMSFPQHVALRHGGAWASPKDHGAYYAAMCRHLRSPGRLFIYTAGGFLLETAMVAAVGLASLLLGYPRLAVLVVGISLGINVVYILVMDLPWALKFNHPCGDLTGLWWTARLPTALLVVAMLGVRGGILWRAIA
jgi:hypothetical protein